MKGHDKIILFLLYLLLSGYYLIAFPHQLSASDTIFYMMSARELSEGMIWEGINSYWGILISVMMVPLMLAGIKGLWAFKVIQLLIGLWAVHLTLKLSERFELEGPLAFWAMITSVFLVWMMSMSHTPDLLMLALLLAYFIETGNYSNQEGVLTGMKIGGLGALLYLCKGYGFPFFIAHFLIWSAYQKIKIRKDTAVQTSAFLHKNFLAGMLVFMIIAGSWIAVLSIKYGHFTLGSSGSYNFAYMGPEMQFNPPYFDRLQNPSTAFTIYFIGEEQGLFADYGRWNPFGSTENFNYLLNRIPANFSKLYYITYLRDLVLFIILVSFLFLFFKCRLRPNDKEAGMALLIFLGIYNAGYFILFPNERYLWINHILLTLAFFKLLSYLWESKNSFKISWVIFAVALLVFAINIQDRVEFRTLENGFHNMLHKAKPGIEALQLSGKNVVSNIKPKPSDIPDYMDPTCLLMYDNKFRLWGFISTQKLSSTIPPELTKAGIDYFFLWGKQTDIVPFSDYQMLYANAEIGLRIFDLQSTQ